MKKILLLIAFLFVTLFVGCSDDEKSDSKGGTTTETIKVSLTVTDIVDNHATVNASLTEGNFYGAMMVEAVKSNTVTIDYTKEVILIDYVKENGVEVSLPYSNTISNLNDGVEMFSAVIVFNSEGVAVNSDYKVWTAIGAAVGWSDDNSAGDLDEIPW